MLHFNWAFMAYLLAKEKIEENDPCLRHVGYRPAVAFHTYSLSFFYKVLVIMDRKTGDNYALYHSVAALLSIVFWYQKSGWDKWRILIMLSTFCVLYGLFQCFIYTPRGVAPSCQLILSEQRLSAPRYRVRCFRSLFFKIKMHSS